MSKTEVQILTPDGDARAYVFHPDQGPPPCPAPLVVTDPPALLPPPVSAAPRNLLEAFTIRRSAAPCGGGHLQCVPPPALFHARDDSSQRGPRRPRRGDGAGPFPRHTGAPRETVDRCPDRRERVGLVLHLRDHDPHRLARSVGAGSAAPLQ